MKFLGKFQKLPLLSIFNAENAKAKQTREIRHANGALKRNGIEPRAITPEMRPRLIERLNEKEKIK